MANPMPRGKLKSLTIDELSGVDRPCQQPATVALMKRAPKLTKVLFERIVKQATLTDEVDGHAHTIDLDDPADRWCDSYSTSYQTSAGASEGHSHAWTYDATTGNVTIAADSGHKHTVTAKVPADVIAAAVLNEAAERTRRAAQNAERAAEAVGSGAVTITITPPVDPPPPPSVVVVAARAPDVTPAAKSSPSGAVPTVIDNQEPITMTTDPNARIRDLEAANTRLEKMLTLSDAQRAYFAKLKGGDADNYLNLTPSQQESILIDLEKADEIVYTASDGTKYRKSAPVEIINAAKATDAMNGELAKVKAERRDLEFAKRGGELFANIFKGARGDVPMRLMRAIENEFTKAEERDEVLKGMRQYEAAFVELTKAKGYTPTEEHAAEPQTPQAKLDALAAEYAKQNNVPIHKAFDAVLVTPAGGALYAQIPTVRA